MATDDALRPSRSTPASSPATASSGQKQLAASAPSQDADASKDSGHLPPPPPPDDQDAPPDDSRAHDGAAAGAPLAGNLGIQDTALAATSSEADTRNLRNKEAPNEDGERDSDNLAEATLLGRYRITRKIGQGGMGAVYEATHTLIGKRVAVKVLLDKYAKKDSVVARLEQEARLASSIGHEHIIDITDFGETDDGRTFVVMEFLEGESLGACIQREGPLPEPRAVAIAYQAAGALHAAHEKGILHRDVKPENIFLLARKGKDFVKVVDFGISKSIRNNDDELGGRQSPRLTQTGMVLGTPLYMSPEQARGSDDVDRRIDVYALGVILYEMMTGEVPFHGSNYLHVISQVINDEARPPSDLRPDISPELEAIIMRALAKDPNDRYPSCEALAADLELLLDDPLGTGARGRITANPIRRRGAPRRSGLRTLMWVASVAVTVAAVVLVVNALVPSAPPGSPDLSAATSPVLPDAAPLRHDAAAQADNSRPNVVTVTLTILTKPPGATIYREGVKVGETPLDHSEVRKDIELNFTAKLDGYESRSFMVNPFVQTGRPIEVELEKSKPRGGGVKTPIVPKPEDPQSKPGGTSPKPNEIPGGGELDGNPYNKPKP